MLNVQRCPFFPIQLIVVDVVALQLTAATRLGGQNIVLCREIKACIYGDENKKHAGMERKWGRGEAQQLRNRLEREWVVGAGLPRAQLIRLGFA
jgi:hypothetical protein